MLQRVVPVAFSRDEQTSDTVSDFRFQETGFGEKSPPAANFPIDSVPVPQFVEMPEQDLSIWTFARVFQVLVRAYRESVRPMELRPVPIRKDDRA